MAEPAPTPIIPPAEDRKPNDVPREELKTPKAEGPKQEPRIGPKGPGTTSTVSGKPGKFHRELAEFFALPALLFDVTGQKLPAYVWTIRSEKHAYAWADLAERNPALKRKLQALMEGGAYGAVIMTGLALVVPILAYYGIYPRSMINPFALSPAEMTDFEAMVSNRENGANPTGMSFAFGYEPEREPTFTPYD